MVARDIINEVSHMVGDLEFNQILEKIDGDEELSAVQQKQVDRYISGLNIAVDTIASRYYLNLKEVAVTTDNEARVDYSALDDRVYEIVRVKNDCGCSVEFFSLPFSLYLPKRNTKYFVKFKFLPKKVEHIGDDVCILPFVPVRAICYLMVSDILLTKGLYDESRFWFSKFESVITQAVASRRMRTLGVNRLV